MDDPKKALEFALGKYPERVEAVAVEELLMESARQNPKRPAFLKIGVPDPLVKNLRGHRDDRDLVLLVRVPKELAERSESRIILPGEVD